LAEFGAKQFGLRFGHTRVHAYFAGTVIQCDNFLQWRGTLQDGGGSLAECGIKPDSGLNRKVGSMEAGEHKTLWSIQVVIPAKAHSVRQIVSKAFVIGHFLFSIAALNLVSNRFQIANPQ
jgi:hypothetical protein